ncbi:AAA family ATPase [Pedobacter sp. WC2423]|uniref:AAA family ATPase n=1 Tax=Pedobacter sp. WC2423 TaxID=3234142 RepID=UPI0034676218
MTKELKVEIINALENYLLSNTKVTQNDVANSAEINAGYLINMRKKDFTVKSGQKVVEINDKYFIRLAKFIGFELSTNNWTTKPTIQLKDMVTSLQIAKDNLDTAVLIGETGSGKTFSLDAFKSKYPTEVFTVKVGSSDNLPDLIGKVLIALNVVQPRHSTSARIAQIALRLKILRESGKTPLLAFDEAEFMKYAALCAFKELFDILIKECALVLIGTEELIKNLERMQRYSKPGIAQLFRRIKFKIHNIPAIDRRFEQFLNGVEPELKKWLQANCNNYGELHDVMVPAIAEAERTGQPLTLELVKIVLGI